MAIRFRFKSFRPKLLETLPGYNRQQLLADASAGLTVGVLAIPLAMAFAIASGASPSSGLWTAIIAGACISAFGGSRVQIGGPTGAFIPILYSIIVVYGFHNMLAATFMAGVLLLVMGLTGMGSLIRLIPVSVVIGFTNGIAVVIAFSQLRDFFGLDVDKLPAEFFARLRILSENAHSVDWPTTALGVGCVALVLVWGKLAERWPRLGVIPAQMAALLLGTLVSVLFSLPVETLGSRFNGIPQELPGFSFPLPSLESLGRLLPPAITIALLGAIESLLSARVADAQIDDRHDPNQELLAQGIANMASPFFGGIPATGAIARTATNVRAGGRTPLAGLVHCATLLVVVLAAAPLAAYVPISVLAAIVLITAWRMGDWHEFRRLRHFSWNYRIILLSTFVLTVLFDLTIAVEIGMVLASLFFIYRMQALTSVEQVTDTELAAGVSLYALQGSLFFGSIAKLDAQIEERPAQTRVLILDMRELINADTSGIDWLHGLWRAQVRQGGHLLLCSLGRQPASLVQRSGLLHSLGEANIVTDRPAALARAHSLIGESLQ
ncbi:SulP family inorganic anion transporter [Uliginosibacterium sediminicola]|uniref:SulP family inorganic anion transporter n=1 Tax=Uliginosibacterium sediminicola TaxID=2024550 RepID=A0ABU9YWU0_9RHOO